MRSAGLLLAGLLFVAGPSLADNGGPYYPTAVNDLRDARVHRNVYVDSAGRCSAKHRCDFRDLSDALAWVAAQSPTIGSQWTVWVHPGTVDSGGYAYTEQALTFPPFTHVRGFSGLATESLLPIGRTMVKITGTSGVGVTLSTGSSISDLGFNWSGAMEAGYVGMSGAAAVTLTRVSGFFGTGIPSTNTQVDLLTVGNGQTVYLNGCSLQRSGGANNTATRHVVVTGTGTAILYNAVLQASSAQAVVVDAQGGTVRVFGGRIYGGATLDLKQSGSAVLTVDNAAYSTESGTITRAGALTPRITYGNTAPAACTPPEIFVDIDSSTLCACTSANTFKCAAIS